MRFRNACGACGRWAYHTAMRIFGWRSARRRNQAREIATKIAAGQGTTGLEDKQVVALIAYLDRLGRDLFATPPAKETAAK